jgi:GAF domain-containing protein
MMHIRTGWLCRLLLTQDDRLYSLDKTKPNFFTGEHHHLAEALAAQAALGIEKSQLFDRDVDARARAETQSRQLNSLNLVAQAVSSTRDLNEILEIAAREIVTQLNARSCGVTLIDAARTHLEVVAFAGQEGEPGTVGILIPLEGNPGTQQVISTRQSLVIADAQNSPLQNEATREIFKERGTTCLLITPLVARGEVIGTFGTDTSDMDRVFTTEDVGLAATIAGQISGAIENARLYQETQRRAQEIATMADIGREISATLDLSTVLERIAARAMDLMRARDVVLRLLEPDGRLPAAVAIGKYADIYKDWDARLGQGLSGSVAQTGSPKPSTILK